MNSPQKGTAEPLFLFAFRTYTFRTYTLLEGVNVPLQKLSIEAEPGCV